MRFPGLQAGATVHIRGLVLSVDSTHARVNIGDRGFQRVVYVPRAAISAVDRAPDDALIASLCGPHGRPLAA